MSEKQTRQNRFKTTTSRYTFVAVIAVVLTILSLPVIAQTKSVGTVVKIKGEVVQPEFYEKLSAENIVKKIKKMR